MHISIKIKGFINISKPRIIELLILTMIPAIILAYHNDPSRKIANIIYVSLFAIIGGIFAYAGSSMINCFIDRDRDAIMERTKMRAIPMGIIKPYEALTCGIFLIFCALLIFYYFVNVYSMLITLLGAFIYTVVYSILLKQRTWQNIVWGGIAGAIPVVIGWVSVSPNSFKNMQLLLMFLLIFFWTPAHYWPLAIKYSKDYEKIHIPMLPVVKPLNTTLKQIILYTFITIFISIAIGYYMGLIYQITSLVINILWGYKSIKLYMLNNNQIDDNNLIINKKSIALFHYSIMYLTIILIVMSIDVIFRFDNVFF